MQVKMLLPIGGNADVRYSQPEFSYVAGQLVDVDPRLAEAWIASGVAAAAPIAAATLLMDGGGATAEESYGPVVIDLGHAQ